MLRCRLWGLLWCRYALLNQWRERGGGYIRAFFLLQATQFHQAQLNVQALVGGGAEAAIEVKQGSLLVIWDRKCGLPTRE